MNKSRFEFIDHIKAFAVILMVIYHFTYDLYVLKIVAFNMGKSLFWYSWPKIIITIFLISTGINLCLINKNGIKPHKVFKRFFKLSFVALIISIATYYFYPSKWISFGVIHHIAVASLVGLLFLKKPKLSLVLGVSILVPSIFFGYDYPIPRPVQYPLDHVAFLPWFGFVLIGIFAYHKKLHEIKVPNYKFKSFVNKLGKYSLEIYLIHQLVLYPGLYLFKKYVL
jgi:uncharacterized membrane protein